MQKPAGIVAAFIPGSNPESLRALQANQHLLTHACPDWLSYTDIGGGIEEDPDSAIGNLPEERSWKLIPVLSNIRGEERVPEAVELLSLTDDGAKRQFVEELAEKLSGVGAAGVAIDWQEVDQGANHQLGALVAFIADGLRGKGFETWLCVAPDGGFLQWDFESLAPRVDRFVALLHGEHGTTDTPGPVASLDWFSAWLDVLSKSGGAAKWIAGIGTYGHDYGENQPEAEEISFAEAVSRAGNAGCSGVSSGPPFFNAHFTYFFTGESHEVWFPDAATFANQCRAVHSAGLAGIALDRLGFEDPGIWEILSQPMQVDPSKLSTVIPGGYGVTSIGKGEVVNLDPTVLDGRRKFSVGADGNIASSYSVFPAHPTLFRMGGHGPERVCLSFDDGPDPRWTPQILDILKERGVKAAFFVVGKNAELHPDLIRRIADEGHEIGNHSFTHSNLAALPESMVKVELNATQRLIESLIGKSTTLFRPPYNADSHPSDAAELAPIRVAESLGYMTVLENIDPCDWQEPAPGELLRRIKEQRHSGNIILLHDSGGDRSSTVAALPAILDYLEERGDKIVSLSELVGIPKEEVMPPVIRGSNELAFLASGTGFGLIRILQASFFAFLTASSILVAARTLIVVFLAIRHSRQPGLETFADDPVSIIIPAYNEEKVVARTVRSLLASDYPGPLEVVVVDDGSSDGTAAAVSDFSDPRVRLVRQSNSGKAVALRNGIAQASAEILVFADADTQFDKAAVRHLVAALGHEKTGAVSGQARVGNARTLAARCQEIEYLCNFNLDRRAYAAWNCITVVPGAISALRREAIVAAGGISLDTLAEDTDLTLAIHRAGYRVEYAPKALAFTEAPETFRQLVRQRFRWAYGTIQCVWKHRDLVFNPRFKALGFFSLPSIWFFQIALVALSPFIDLAFLQSILLGRAMDILPFFLGFLACDLVLAIVAVRLEGLPLRNALRILPQRFIYRPLLAWVVWKSILQAIRGAWVGWGKLHRNATVAAAQ
ncbi:MAG: polysaccharide deacetylase family protein [Verrucomicrobiota bacterium]